MNKDFQAYYEEALARAGNLRTAKAHDYDPNLPGCELFPNLDVPDYAPFGAASFLTWIWQKTLRLYALCRMAPLEQPTNESIEDTLLDLINYAAFFWAWLNIRKEVTGHGNH